MLLTGEGFSMSVFVHVVCRLSHSYWTGFRLIGTQSLPLLLETVLITQVILHIRLRKRWDTRNKYFINKEQISPICSTFTLHADCFSLTSIMWPVEMSMLDWAGSSLQDGVELWVEDGLCWGPSLNWEETLLTRDVSVPLRPPAPVLTAGPEMLLLTPPIQSWRHREDLDAMCCRHSSWTDGKLHYFRHLMHELHAINCLT